MKDKDKLIAKIKNNMLKPDDTFRFHCTQCGKCCTDREDILLNAKDVFFISKKLGITPQELIEKYGDAYIGPSTRIPVVRLKPIGRDKRCPFLDDSKKCSIHEVKPVVCAMFPIGRAAILDNERADKKSSVEYFFTDPECGDDSESHTVSEWLSGFGIPLQDEVFNTWQQSIASLCTAVAALEKVAGEKSMNIIWNHALRYMYLNYDTGKDFLPQFHDNMDRLGKLAEAASSILKEAGTESKKGIEIKARPVQWNERVAYECDRCGACCRHVRESVPIDSKDAFCLARFFQGRETGPVNIEGILKRYAEPVLLNECGYFIFTLKTIGPEDACIFLKDNLCTIQEAKPLACRTYPFSAEPNGSGSFNFHVCMDQPHHFKGQQIKARDFMKRYFRSEDKFFVNEDVTDSKEIAALLHGISESRYSDAVSLFLQYRYYEYDLDQPFLEQFKHNNMLLLARLRELAQV